MPLTSQANSSPVALVTGAAARVGRAIALELALEGAYVWVHYRSSAERAEETLSLIQAAGGAGSVIQADLSSRASITQLCAHLKRHHSRLDVLVHNASLFEPAELEELSDERWDEMMQVNLTAPFMLTRELLPALRAARGLIINLCDIGAERPLRGYAHYSVSKAGLVALTRALAVDLAPEVRAVGISPGQVAWPPDMPTEEREALTERVPLRRCGSPSDVARLARFLWREGGYLNGAVIPVDGGLSCPY